MGIDLYNINLDDNFDEEDPNTTIVIRLLTWQTKFEKRKELEKKKKKIKWRINLRCVTSYKVVGLVCVRRWENENRSNIY